MTLLVIIHFESVIMEKTIEQVIADCVSEASAIVNMANFMRSIGHYRQMNKLMARAKNWSLHIDLLIHIQLSTDQV